MPNIVMIPTSLERNLIEKSWRNQSFAKQTANQMDETWVIELCGFGLVAAAALSAESIARHHPRRVLLLGIAGALSERVKVGDAVAFTHVQCHGIGVGTCLSPSHRSASELGWQQCEADERAGSMGDSLRLSVQGLSTSAQGNPLVSVTCASADSQEASRRIDLFPDAIAEDMEGYGVALSCARAGIPLSIVRGISNRAGDRVHANWKIEPALQSALRLALPLLQSSDR